MKFIYASEWREMNTEAILQSIEIAVRVLRERDLTNEHRRFIVELTKELVDLAKPKP